MQRFRSLVSVSFLQMKALSQSLENGIQDNAGGIGFAYIYSCQLGRLDDPCYRRRHRYIYDWSTPTKPNCGSYYKYAVHKLVTVS